MKKEFIILILFFVLSLVVFGDGKNILVIESYSGDFKWDSDYKKGIEKTIPKGNNIIYFEMNTKRLPLEMQQSMADKAFQKYLELLPDIVVLGDDAALKMVGPKLADKEVPVVYLGINNNPRNYFKELPKNMTGVLERPLLKRSMMYVREIMPNVTKALIMFDTNITSEIIKKEIFENKNQLNINGIETNIVLVDKYSEWKNIVLGSKEKYDFIIIGLYQSLKDEKGNIVNMDEVIKWTSENTPIPIFGFWDFSIGKDKTIGGYVLSGIKMGETAGKIITEIINGKDVKEIFPITENNGVFIYSKFQLKKWNLKLTKEIMQNVEFVE